MPGLDLKQSSKMKNDFNFIDMPFGATVLPNQAGVLFQLWAPTAETVELSWNDKLFSLKEVSDGWYAQTISDAKPGDLYQYRINQDLMVPDPASRFQPHDVHGPSQVVDPVAFQWKDTNWRGLPWEETIFYELHVGTFTPQGTFKALETKLDYLVDLGITAIELMPVSDFPGGRNWGYDGVLHFAPESRYGTPEELKQFIQAAHKKGLMVFLDVVYNHFGPEGNYLHVYAKHFFTERYKTPWGAAIDFESMQPVRDFFIWNALYWLHEYHFDGLRLDAVHAIEDASPRHFVNELAQRVYESVPPGRQIHLVLENDDNAARYFRGEKSSVFNAQWNDDFHHGMHVLLTGENTGYYVDYVKQSLETFSEKTSGMPAAEHVARCLTEGFSYQGECSPYRQDARRGEKSSDLPLTTFVNFLQNHDQIGNRAFGERLSQLAEPRAIRAALTVLLLAPSVPMLFMGEEWQTRQPFLFFCDFGADLAPLVTEGRRQEFATFPEFNHPEKQLQIPDPGNWKTFQASVLNWEELAHADHAEWLALCKRLIRLRKELMIPALRREGSFQNVKRGYELLSDAGFLAWWQFSTGEVFVLAANLGEEALTLPALKPHNRINLGEAQLVYESESAVFKALGQGVLPGWSSVWLKQP